MALAIGASLLYVLVAFVIPAYNLPLVDAHVVAFGLFALSLIGVPRMLSYGIPQVAKSVSAALEAAATGE